MPANTCLLIQKWKFRPERTIVFRDVANPFVHSAEGYILKKAILALVISLAMLGTQTARADVLLNVNSSDFAITDTFNEITFFNFDITLSGSIVAGGTYVNPAITGISYRVNGTLPNATPSGFPGFALVRSYSGTDFYDQSPESGMSFSIKADADLTNGLQLDELVGTGTDNIFYFNAREFDQNPGRYHPPEFFLRADGTGRLWNANNKSVFPNPDPPSGSGLLVDVDFGEEYIADLEFTPSAVTLATGVPEPASATFIAIGVAGLVLRRRRNERSQ